MSKKSKGSLRLADDGSVIGRARRRGPRRPTMDTGEGDPSGDEQGWNRNVDAEGYPTKSNAPDEVDGAPYRDSGRPE